MFDGCGGNGWSINISELDFCAGLELISGLSNHFSYMGRGTCLIISLGHQGRKGSIHLLVRKMSNGHDIAKSQA